MVNIKWDDKRKNFVTNDEDIGSMTGFQTILNKCGDLGYELVNVLPYFHQIVNYPMASSEALNYYLFFKRPKP
jgi:hypothetical protein